MDGLVDRGIRRAYWIEWWIIDMRLERAIDIGGVVEKKEN